MDFSLYLSLFISLQTIFTALGDRWEVAVYTKDEYLAGTSGKRTVKVYGSNDNTDYTSFYGDVSRGESERTDTYMDMREPYEIKVTHSGSGVNPAWLLRKVRLYNYNTGSEYDFYCGCWLDDESEYMYPSQTVCKDIPFCKRGKKRCHGRSSSKCTDCEYPFSSGGWDRGCRECMDISNCPSRSIRCDAKLGLRCTNCNYPFSSGGWDGGCRYCRDIYHCPSSSVKCDAYRGLLCTDCSDPYYSGGWDGGCNLCPSLHLCVDRYCSSRSNVYCRRCEDNRKFFKPSSDARRCERMCAWNNHYCWPGTCGDGVVKNCHCSNGFSKYTSSFETSCQLTTLPSFEDCLTGVIGPHGEKRNSMPSEQFTNECRFQKDFYGNFKPSRFSYKLMAEFRVSTNIPERPRYISTWKFGLTGVTIVVLKKTIHGSQTVLTTKRLLSSSAAGSTFHSQSTISVPSNYIRNGERLCLKFMASGGGYLTSMDISISYRPTTQKSYRNKLSERLVCYRFDNAAPKHCRETRTCTEEPLELETRISKSPNITVQVHSWFDPIPTGGSQEHASAIEFYEITVHEVSGTNESLKVGVNNLFTKKVQASLNLKSITLRLPSGPPKLFCVGLEVKDFADNVGHARRFFLYDNTTFLETRFDQPFYVSSASKDTNYKWQTHHNRVCLDWRNHFYNRFYLDNHLLSKIEPDPHGFIRGVYEQNTGVLPVSGTPNVYGIIKFEFSFSKNNSLLSAVILVPDFQNQTYCHTFNLKDGDTYNLKINAIDIVDNQYSEERIVYIDRSVPHIENIWLVKDGYKQLYVHDQTDLSKMNLQFDAYDPHSGIKTIEWLFGVTDYSEIEDEGSIGVSVIDKMNCSSTKHCYCPVVGNACERLKYSVPLHGLVYLNKHIGNHNRKYYFTIKVTNNANLLNTEHMEVLVDDSPPQAGIVLEGPDDIPDIDYTSDESFIVRWNGFIDHESGIKLYRISLANRCLSKLELHQMNESLPEITFREVTNSENILKMPANFTGKRFVSVIALNNAMGPSDAVCSDGIIKDVTPPEIKNLTIENAKWQESIYCHENETWFLQLDLRKLRLPNTQICSHACIYEINHPLINILPETFNVTHLKNVTKSPADFLCSKFPVYGTKNIIYLPSDRIVLRWNIVEETSQILDYYVGFGVDPTESDAPGLIDYASTSKKTVFKINHIGVGIDKEFYMFLKAANTAGLESTVPIGPLLIDETPPRYREIPGVKIDDNNIVIGWEKGTFYDDEQAEQISQILFQIGQGDRIVSSTLEWRLGSVNECPAYSGGCFRYPLSRLKVQDTDLGLMFHVLLYVYNNAKHFITVKTEEFILPSMFPPGHAIVVDFDPMDDISNNPVRSVTIDTDAHFTDSTVCASWSGFQHHEQLTLEFGVGSSKETDDIHTYTLINNTNSHCLTSPNIPDEVKLYAILRANSTGGSTVSSSDGLTIYNASRVMHALSILNGPECITSDQLISVPIQISGDTISLNKSLVIGRIYTMRITNKAFFDQHLLAPSDDIYIKQIKNVTNNLELIFQPCTELPTFYLSGAVNGSETDINIELYGCEDDVLSDQKSSVLEAHLRGLPVHFTYESVIVRFHCLDISNETCVSYLTPWALGNTSSLIFRDLTVQSQVIYYVGIRLCLNLICLEQKLSTGVYIEPENVVLNITKTETYITYSNCTRVLMEWEPLSTLNVSFYQWSVAATIVKAKAASTFVKWITVPPGKMTRDTIQVDRCIQFPFHGFKRVFGCVRAYSYAGKKIEACKSTRVITDFNTYEQGVYDLDARSSSWATLRKAINSYYLGGHLGHLHEEELDFGTKDSQVAGAVLYGTERNITWFLTTARFVPTTCKVEPECKASLTTDVGYVIFPMDTINLNTLYYICASANELNVTRETFTETFTKIEMCSNGFILDDTPPYGGEVHVTNLNGYINDLEDIVVSWDGFGDNINARLLGYESTINSYSVEIGTGPFRSDIKQYSGISYDESLLLTTLNIGTGTTIFISVIAMDHAGLHTRVTSDPLVVDTTPPLVGRITTKEEKLSVWLSGSVFEFQLTEFSDQESGIAYYVTHVGSAHHKVDIMPERQHTSHIITLHLQDMPVMDSHFYFLGCRAVNRAGLSSNYVFAEFGIDQSPPTGGHVIDGLFQTDITDVDFQTETNYIGGHWKGFVDPHSGIAYYRVGLGTSPFTVNTEPLINVGLHKDILWNSTFVLGEKYYITVEACNGAGLCHSVSSDGLVLDNSPPTPGIVKVGSSSYIPRNSSIEIFWTGFFDPQSGMDHFEACVGTRPGACDIIPLFNCLLLSTYIKTGLNMPLNLNMYAKVTGYNKHNMSVSKTSDSFLVDISPPECLVKPRFVKNFTSVRTVLTQWEKSVLRIFWKFHDSESPIVRQHVTLLTHHEGHTPIEDVELGHENKLTISFDDKNWLHNGDTYKVKVTACNAAGHCSTEESNDLLIDATPPHVGGFRPPMTWHNYVDANNQTLCNVTLTWYGFHDQESGIRIFYIGIGRTYTDNDMTDGLVTVEVNELALDYNTTIQVNRHLLLDDKIVASIIAENKAGLRSPIARVTLLPLLSSPANQLENASGIMEIEKHSCEVHFCNNDCTCAVVGKVCSEVETNLTCIDASDQSDNPFNVSVRVYDGTLVNPEKITPSSACLSSHWIVDNGFSQIKRFEWTLGVNDQPYGEGIFDLLSERPWQDVGLFQSAVHCLPVNRSLLHRTEYVMYVKVWVAMDRYIIVQSPPVLVDQSPPAIRTGKFVMESDSTCANDYDLIDWTDKITACWSGVFYEPQGMITHYIVALGTAPKADDILKHRNVKLNTRFQATNLSLSHGQRYYFTVTAYNNAGLHTTEISDGFVVDTDIPVAGVVYNTARYRNYPAQSATDIFEVSWHGFLDHDSGIKSYFLALLEESDNQTFIRNFTSYILQTSVKLSGLNLKHGRKYYGAVKAIDAVMHESDVIYSTPKLIDKTPPTTYICTETAMVHEIQSNSSDAPKLTLTTEFLAHTLYTINGTIGKAARHQYIQIRLAHRIRKYLPLQRSHDGTFQFDFNFYSDFEGIYDVTLEMDFPTSHILDVFLFSCNVSDAPNFSDAIDVKQISQNLFKISLKVIDPESGIKSALLGVGKTPTGFQLKPLFPIQYNGDSVISLDVSHGTPVYVTVMVENFAGLRSVFRSSKLLTDHTAPALNNVAVNADFTSTGNDTNTTLFENEALICLDVSWKVKDEESDIVMCLISVGSVPYREDILPSTVALQQYRFISDSIKVAHGSKLYANVKCINNVQLATMAVSDPVVVSVTRPSNANARVCFVPISQYELTMRTDSCNDRNGVQSNRSSVQFFWGGFTDTSGIDHYEYRLSTTLGHLTHWTKVVGGRFISLDSLDLYDDHFYTVEVRAVNSGLIRSNPVNATLLIEGRVPQLTGQDMNITYIQRAVTIDWIHIFKVNPAVPVTFDVTVGSAPGFADIADIRSVSDYTFTFHVPTTSILTPFINELFFTVTCCYATGLRASYQTSYKFTK